MFVFLNIVQYLTTWFMFPDEMRVEKEGRKKILAYIKYRFWVIGFNVQLLILTPIMRRLGENLQWTMSIILPLVREANFSMMTHILENAVESKSTVNPIPRICAAISTNVIFAFFVALKISNATFKRTGYGLVAVDVLINFYCTYKIIKSYRMIAPEMEEEGTRRRYEVTEEVMKLIVTELVEFLVPICYLISFFFAFYGPNADLIGGVKFSEWHYSSVEDIARFSSDLTAMFVCDFACLILSATLLLKLSSTNALNETYKMAKMFWLRIAMAIAGSLFIVGNLKR